jgi:hypothetical protein
MGRTGHHPNAANNLRILLVVAVKTTRIDKGWPDLLSKQRW